MKRPSPPPVTTPVHAVGAAILSGRRCFVVQRAEDMALPFKWEFAGGKVEDGEDPAEALAREIAEELSLEIEVGEYLGRGVVGEVTLDVYLAHVAAGSVALREHRDARWIGADQIDGLDWAEADVAVLGRLQELLQDLRS